MKISTVFPQDLQLETQDISVVRQSTEQIITGAIISCEGTLEDHQTKVRLTTRATQEELEDIKAIFKKISTRLEKTNLEEHHDAEVW